jgi:hypothetical protein
LKVHPASSRLVTSMQPSTTMRRGILLGLALTALSIALHFAPIWVTMLNRGPVTWDGQPLAQDLIAHIIEEHRAGSDMSFRRRPLTTWCVDALTTLGLSPKIAFVSLGFGLFLVCGLLVRRIARLLSSTDQQADIAQAAFHLSPTVLCAWFEPMYTYDEPLQYVAFLIAFAAAWQGRVALASIAMAVSLIAHETSLFLLPAFLAIPRLSRNARWILMLAPALLFALFLIIFLPTARLVEHSANDAVARLGTAAFNFSSWAMAGETLGYALIVLLVPVVLLWRSAASASEDQRRLLRAFWIALIVNSLAVLVAAKAREARVFALPLLIAWPLLGWVLTDALVRRGGWRLLLAPLRKPLPAVLFSIAAAGIYMLTRAVFLLSTNVAGDNLWHEFLALHISAIALLSWRAGSRPLPAKLEVPS